MPHIIGFVFLILTILLFILMKCFSDLSHFSIREYYRKTKIKKDGWYSVLWISFESSNAEDIVNNSLTHYYQCCTQVRCLYLNRFDNKEYALVDARRVFKIANHIYNKKTFNIGLEYDCVFLKEGDEFDHVYNKIKF